ncbi:hypothetical protein NL676_009088 [Syzygium grande]|nr:hypothetical protein NL676_009088 [Syzygium grande]
MASSPGSGEAATARRGIPGAQFVEDVRTYLAPKPASTPTPPPSPFLQERYLVEENYNLAISFSSGYQSLLNFSTCKSVFRERNDWIPKFLWALSGRLNSKALLADFEVSEGIYSQARIEDTDSVCLWLGANVMLEYSCEEATALLQKNLENAKASLEVLVADLQFLRDQVTITQVTIARVYNWDAHQKRIRQAGAPAKDS